MTRPEDTTNRMVDNPTHANRKPSVADPVGFEAPNESPDIESPGPTTVGPIDIQASGSSAEDTQAQSQFEDSASILAAQDPDAPTLETTTDDQTDLKASAAGDFQVENDEPATPTEEVMGASHSTHAAVEDSFLRGEVDVTEEMARATRRMDNATGRSRPHDTTPSM